MSDLPMVDGKKVKLRYELDGGRVLIVDEQNRHYVGRDGRWHGWDAPVWKNEADAVAFLRLLAPKGTEQLTSEDELTVERLVADLEWLLVEGKKIAKFDAPKLGRHFDSGIGAIRKIATGQTVGVSLRYVEAIIAALKSVRRPLVTEPGSK